jgi:hypothetical protein
LQDDSRQPLLDVDASDKAARHSQASAGNFLLRKLPQRTADCGQEFADAGLKTATQRASSPVRVNAKDKIAGGACGEAGRPTTCPVEDGPSTIAGDSAFPADQTRAFNASGHVFGNTQK